MDPASWLAWWPVILGVAGLIGGAVAWLYRAYRDRGTDHHERQKTREETATRKDDQVFTRTEALIDQYQQALKESREEIIAVKQQCIVDLADLRARADDMERRYLERIAALDRQVAALQLECSNLRMQL